MTEKLKIVDMKFGPTGQKDLAELDEWKRKCQWYDETVLTSEIVERFKVAAAYAEKYQIDFSAVVEDSELIEDRGCTATIGFTNESLASYSFIHNDKKINVRIDSGRYGKVHNEELMEILGIDKTEFTKTVIPYSELSSLDQLAFSGAYALDAMLVSEGPVLGKPVPQA